MEFSIESLVREHREIEASLEAVAAGLLSGVIDQDALRRAHSLCVRHYEREEDLLAGLGERDAAKLRGQHAEALDLADALLAAPGGDAIYLTRRFLAIVQHNMIEEERDVFPYS